MLRVRSILFLTLSQTLEHLQKKVQWKLNVIFFIIVINKHFNIAQQYTYTQPNYNVLEFQTV
jgi:hypothetical protein